LQWNDVDFNKATAIVQSALVWNRKGGGWSLQEPKTSQSRHAIPLPISVLNELKTHRKNQFKERLRLGQAYQIMTSFLRLKSEPLFCQAI